MMGINRYRGIAISLSMGDVDMNKDNMDDEICKTTDLDTDQQFASSPTIMSVDQGGTISLDMADAAKAQLYIDQDRRNVAT